MATARGEAGNVVQKRDAAQVSRLHQRWRRMMDLKDLITRRLLSRNGISEI